jgi:hypothetical protein
MADFILFMHTDVPPNAPSEGWDEYLDKLKSGGRLGGGSAVGSGQCFRRGRDPAPLSSRIGGYIRVTADDMADARTLLAGNPVYEAGGTVEIRELPKS